MNLALVLSHLFPGVVIGEQGASECSIAMGADGVPCIETWLRPEPMPTAEQIEAARQPAEVADLRSRIKAEARRRILAFLPEWKQANCTARMVEKLAAGEVGDAEWLQMQALWDRVKAIRAHSDALEASAAENPGGVDILAGWPE